MTILNNKTELADLLDIIDELESLAHDFDSGEVIDAATNLLTIVKGDIAKKKVHDHGFSKYPRVLDTYIMMVRQHYSTTFKNLSIYNHSEDCVLAKYEKQNHLKSLIWG